MVLKNLRLSFFRNYHDLKIEFPDEGAIFEGQNGSGKTNVLESIYLLCTGKSQRNAKKVNMIHYNSEFSFIEGEFISDQLTSVIASYGFNRSKKIVMKLNETIVGSVTEWFGKRPIVSFGVDDLDLVYGAPEIRRRYIDITCSQIDADYLSTLLQYTFYLKCRNHLLTHHFDSVQCEIYEQKMAETGSYLISKRENLIKEINTSYQSFYKEICNHKEISKLVYIPSINCDCSSRQECKNVFYSMLQERRIKDLETGFSSVGPHRDDICFILDEKHAKSFGSQGQCRSIALSLKLSSVVCIEKYRKEKMIFLIDDAVSELDPQRTSRVIPLIESKGQLFIASPKFSIPLKQSLPKFTISEGNVVAS
jgi:DNA replication and repair protein RecF